MTTRKYSSRSQQTTLSASLTDVATTCTVVSGTGVLGGATVSAGQTFTIVIDPDTALEEIVDVTAVSTNTFTIVRGIETAGVGQAHSAGAVVRHMATGRDFREANEHIEAVRANSATAHGIPLATVVLTSDTGTVSTAMLASNAVTTAKITDANVTTAKIADSAITSAKIADLTIATGDIADSAITSGKIATGAVGTVKIDDLSVTEGKLAPSAVTAGKIATDAVTTAKILDANVTTAKIADSAITSAKIADGTIVVGDIADGAITSAKILDGTIVAGDIADGAITSAKILDGTIVNADINSSAQVAYSKLNLTNSIVDADVNASAAIDWTKIAPSATVSTTELGYLDGVTSAIQTQLDSKLATSTAASTYAPLASPALTGVPTAPTAAADTNTTQIATTAYVQGELNQLVNSAPLALDTLKELADALGSDANFSTTVTNSIATKLPLAGGTMSGAIAMGTNKITGLGDPTSAQDAATKNYIDTAAIAPSNLTGPITSVGPATSVASQTGTGSTFVMNTSPTLVTPVLGVATATSINGTSIPSSKTLVATDSTTYVVPSQTSNAGKYLTTDGTTSSWGTVATYSAPTIGSTSIGSGATVTTIAGLTLTSPVENNPILKSPQERTTVSATAATGTVNFDASTQGTLYYTSNASANWTLNVRASSGTTLSSTLAVGDAVTIAFLVTQGSTAYYPSAHTIDGTSVTPKWQGGTAPTSGNASSTDAYVYTIIKTAATPTYLVLASQTKFA